MTIRKRLAELKQVIVEQYLGLVVFAVLVAVISTLMTGLMFFNSQIVIRDDDRTIRVLTEASDPYEILAENEIAVGENDIVIADLAEDGEGEIIIYRACEVTITADGKTFPVYATEIESVEVVLDKAGVTLGEDDIISVPVTEMSAEGMEIVINRVKRVVETKVTAIPFETEHITSSFYKRGTTNIVTEGVDGELTTTAETTYIDGKVTAFNIIKSEVTLEPVTEVIATGTAVQKPISTAKEVELDANGVPVSYSKVLTGKATAYQSKYTYVKGASGKPLYVGTFAVDPNIIPYGTEAYIVSTDGSVVYGYAVAADTGTALMDGIILADLFMASYSDSCKWGAHQVNIYILD